MRHIVFLRQALLLTAFFYAAAPAWGTEEDPAVSFRRALFDFTQGDYKPAIVRLEKLLDPIRLDAEDDVIEARKTLGTMYFLLGEEDKARAQFELALLIRRDTQLDLYATAPPVLRFFDEIKLEMEQKAVEVDRVYKLRRIRFEAPRYIERDRIKHIELLCYLPFGIGQFQNGQIGMGILFLTLDVVALAVNILGYVFGQLLADDTGIIAPKDLAARNGFLAMQYTGLGVFGAGWIAGAIHARVNFQPVVTVERERGQTGSQPASGLNLRVGLQLGIRY